MDGITQQQLIGALAHEDFFVRSAVLDFLSEVVSDEIEPARLAVATVEKFGWDGSFRYPHQMASLKADGETLEWIVARLDSTGKSAPGERERRQLRAWFDNAPVEHLPAYSHRMPVADGLVDQGGTSIPHALASRRVELAGKSSDECFALIAEGVDLCEADKGFPHALIRDLELVCERLVIVAPPAALSERVLSWLDVDCEPGADPTAAHWLAGIAIHLVGLTGLEPALQKILALFGYDWDWWDDGIETAVASMRSDDVLSELIAFYLGGESCVRLFISGAFSQGRFPGLEPAIAQLLDHEKEDDLRVKLGFALARLGTQTSMATARVIHDEVPDDPERFEIARILYALRTILGEDDATMRGWGEQMESRHSQRRELDRVLARPEPKHLPPPPKKRAPREPIGKPVERGPDPRKQVGRNDPCPCGSGKKFKECCLPGL